MGIFVALAVLVAASAAGVWFTLSRTDDSPHRDDKGPQAVRQLPGDVEQAVEKAPEDLLSAEVMSTEFDETPKGAVSGSYGTWLTKKYLARARIDGDKAYIEAYRLQSKGKQQVDTWKIPLGVGICGLTRDVTVDGRTAVVTYAPGPNGKQTCGRLVVVDLNRGRIVWSKGIPNSVTNETDTWGVALSQSVAAVSWAGGTAAYDLKNRELLWSDSQASKCETNGFVGGRQLLAVVACTAAGSERKDLKVAKVDPRSGKQLWVYSPGSYGHVAIHVISSQPAVLAIYTKVDASPSHLIALDDKGKRLSTIPLRSDIHDVTCPPNPLNLRSVDDCRGVVASNKYAFVTSKDKYADDTPSNNVAAYDLRTGKGVARFDSALLSPLHVLQANGDNALAVQDGTTNPLAVYELRVESQKKIPFMFFNSDESFDPESGDVLYRNGVLALGNQLIEKGRIGELIVTSRTKFYR